MRTNQAQIDFGDGREAPNTFSVFESIITDRKSVYAVSGGKVKSQEDVKALLEQLKLNKKFAQASHNSYAARVSHNHQIWETKCDDGETGAGAVILRIMQKQNITNTVIVVTRWFGGIHLMNDRFKHIQDATKYFIAHM